MNWLQTIWRHMITAYIIAVTSAMESRDVTSGSGLPAADPCPDDYWDDSSKRCARPLVTSLELLRPVEPITNWTLSDPHDISRTCGSWHQTSQCYTQLLRLCQYNSYAHHELRTHLHRYSLYSATCSPSQFKRRRKLIECFLPHIKPTLTCTEAFEKYFRNYVAEKQYRNACRVVSTALKCFHEIQLEVAERCPDEGLTSASLEYQLLYILPLIEKTRDDILNVARCDISAPCDAYFVTATSGASAVATPGKLSQTMVASSLTSVLCSTLVAFLFSVPFGRVIGPDR